MQLIKHYELASAQSSIVFSDIPQTYTDLYLVLSTRSSAALTVADPYIGFNGSTSSFSGRRLFGNGTNASSDSTARFIQQTPGANATANTFGNGVVYIPNYTSSNYKSFSSDGVSENNATNSYQSINAGLWSNTAAITSIEITLSSGNFAQYSSATLFGILAGSDGTTTVS